MSQISWLCGLLLLLSPLSLSAQTAGSTSALGWDQVAPSLSDAQSYVYRSRADGTTAGTVLAGVVCSGTASPFLCRVPFPAFTPGPHTLTVTAGNAAGESSPSPVLSFTFVVIPAAPSGLRIEPAAN